MFLYAFDIKSFVGFDNYCCVFVDLFYMNVLRIMVIFMLGCLVLFLGFGILIVFLLNVR